MLKQNSFLRQTLQAATFVVACNVCLHGPSTGHLPEGVKCHSLSEKMKVVSVQVAALSQDSGPAMLRARLPLTLSNPLMGQPPRVSNPTLPSCLSGLPSAVLACFCRVSVARSCQAVYTDEQTLFVALQIGNFLAGAGRWS